MDAARQAGGRASFGPLDTARYVAALGRELAEMARPHPELGLLGYLLDVAILEASDRIARLSDDGTSGSAGSGPEREIAGRMAVEQARELELDQDQP